MKNRKKRHQREEVRKILESMRLELAAQRLSQEQSRQSSPMLRLNEVVSRARSTLRPL